MNYNRDIELWKELFNMRFNHGWKEPGKVTLKQVDFITSVLNINHSDNILDAGCGNGRHLLELCKRGFLNLTGVDFTDEPLYKAKKIAQEKNYNISFIIDDLRNYSPKSKFDIIYSIDYTIGLLSNNDNKILIKNMSTWLKPGGLLLLELFHDGDLEFFISKNNYQLAAGQCELETILLKNEKRLSFRGCLKSENGIYKYPDQNIRFFSFEEIEEYAKNAGLIIIDKYESSIETEKDKNIFSLNSHTILPVMMKK